LLDVNDTQPLDGDEIKLVIVSAPYAKWAETLAISGIVGLYTVFVLGVGRFLRLSITGLSHLPIYEDMPDVDALLRLCEEVLLARQDGVLELEEELFRELIELYRDPQRMKQLTRAHRPRFTDPNIEPDSAASIGKKKMD